MSSKSVIVIGAGLAGLSSGVALAEAGFRVKLLEQRPFLGGRASSYSLPDGEQIDNCQHVTLGCCTNLEDFYRRGGGPLSLLPARGGEKIDNCQHVTLGCCTNLEDFYRRVGALGKIARYGRL